MKKYLALTLAMLSFASFTFALEPQDEKEITEAIEHFTFTWNHQTGRGLADFYTEDADFVNIFGNAFSGKQNIEERHVSILEGFLKGSFFEVTKIRLREAKPDVVVAHTYWKVTHIKNPNSPSEEASLKGIFTHIMLKNNGKWEITSSQNTATVQ